MSDVKVSAQAMRIVQEGERVLGTISAAFITLAGLVDELPRDKNYNLDPKKLVWVEVEQEQEQAQGATGDAS